MEACVMVEELRQALDALGQLPEEEQRQIAQLALEEIEQRQWDELVGSPRSKAFLKRLIAEAKEGEIEDGGLELP
jgi:DnaJ-domain-containing protein 1